MTLDTALRYARAGYPVLLVWGLHNGKCACGNTQCTTPGKHPMQNAWTKTATADEERVRKMFERVPDAHIGIMPPSGHCIVDVDPRNGGDKTLKALLNGSKLPKTVIQESGGGGLHLFFKGEIEGSLGKGIDIKRAGRGFVVAYPAGHISGGKYTWRNAPWDATPAPVPAPMRKTATYVEPETPIDAPIDKVRAALAFINADDYQRWVNIGQALRHAYGDDGEELWVEWSKTSSKFKEADVDKWKSFDLNRDRPLITVRSIVSIARKNGYRPLTTEFTGSLWQQGDITGFMDNAPPAIEWAFENCIPCGKVTLLAGAGGSSKSFLTLTLALQMCAQLEFGPFKPVTPGKALLLVAEEDRTDVHRRVHAISTAKMYSDAQRDAILAGVGVVSVRGLDWRMLYHDETGDVQETDRVDYLISEIKMLGDVRFVVLDPLVAFNGANENDNAEMSRLMFTLDRIANETGAAVLIVHHVSKGGQVTSLNDASQAVVRGASALVDNARSAILLTRLPRADAPLFNISPDDAGRYVACRFIKNNYGAHMPDAMFTIEAGGSLRHAPEVQRVHSNLSSAQRDMDATATAARIAHALHTGNGEITQRDIAEQIGKSQTLVNRHITQMLEAKHATRTGMGKTTELRLTAAGRKHYQISDDSGSDLI